MTITTGKIIKRNIVPRSLKAAAKMMLCRAWLMLALLPGALAVGFIGGMVMIFVLTLAYVAYLDRSFVALR